MPEPPRRFVLHEHRKPAAALRPAAGGGRRAALLGGAARPARPPARGNRLAVAVPDHDLDHVSYEDTDKSIADDGTWQEEDRNERRLVFTLHGRAGSRRYALIRTGEDWLLHLTKDQPEA